VAASGGYYIACACDHIIAHPTTVTGSIGVIMQLFSLQRTLEKIGVKAEAIKSGPNKDAGSPFRDLSDDERKLFQSIVDEFYHRFLDVVDKGRPKLDKEKIRGLADGRVYTAQQALAEGLVDQIGTITDSVNLIREKAEVEKIVLVTYNRPLGWKPNMYAHAPDPGPATTLMVKLPEWLTDPTPRFLYLWMP
jgi:protease-4